MTRPLPTAPTSFTTLRTRKALTESLALTDARSAAIAQSQRWAANELARLRWERGESEEDETPEPRKALPGFMAPDRERE